MCAKLRHEFSVKAVAARNARKQERKRQIDDDQGSLSSSASSLSEEEERDAVSADESDDDDSEAGYVLGTQQASSAAGSSATSTKTTPLFEVPTFSAWNDDDADEDVDMAHGKKKSREEVPLHVLPLYSLLPTHLQQKVFDPPPAVSALFFLS